MRIEKDLNTIGKFIASQYIKGRGWVVGTGDSMEQAIDVIFEKLKWAGVGNWNKNEGR